MARSVWKGPFVDPSLIKKVDKMKNQTNKQPIKTWSRKSTIIPEFVGFSFLIHNGKKYIPIKAINKTATKAKIIYPFVSWLFFLLLAYDDRAIT